MGEKIELMFIEDTILNQVALKLSMMPAWMENLQKMEQQKVDVM